MKLREKIALIWTFPIIAMFVIVFAVIACVLVFISHVMNLSGTYGAAIYVFDKLKIKIIDRRLRKLVREDEKLYKFDSSKLTKNEDSSSAANRQHGRP